MRSITPSDKLLTTFKRLSFLCDTDTSFPGSHSEYKILIGKLITIAKEEINCGEEKTASE